MNYIRYSESNRTALVAGTAPEAIADALLSQRACEPFDGGGMGRGVLLRFPVDHGFGVIRRFRRGGFIRHFIRESYLLHNRPLDEFEVQLYLKEQGLPVAEPLGVLWERRGLLFRGAIATRLVDAPNMIVFLKSTPPDPWTPLLKSGALIRSMHDLGVYHADLNASNLLIGQDQVYLIDFDKAARRKRVPDGLRRRNLLRLRRSMAKHGVANAHFRTLCQGYGGAEPPAWLARLGGR